MTESPNVICPEFERSNVLSGLVVPIPTLPPDSITSFEELFVRNTILLLSAVPKYKAPPLETISLLSIPIPNEVVPANIKELARLVPAIVPEPTTFSLAVGLVVPIPTLPSLVIRTASSKVSSF